MRWLLGPVAALFLVMPPASSAACSGDCNGNGVVSIDELVTAVAIGLSQSALGACIAADGGGDGRVTVDDLVRAVNAALRGCPPTPSATATASDTATVTATPSPSLVPSTATPSSTVSATATSQATATTVGQPTATPTGEATATATAAASPSSSPTVSIVPTQSETATPDATASPTDTATPTSTGTSIATTTSTRTGTSMPGTATPPPSATPTSTSTASFSPTPSATRTDTPTATASPSSTATGGALGTRRFSLDPATSGFVSVLTQGPLQATGFTGHLDLRAGSPDIQTGIAVIDVMSASEFLQLKIEPDLLICIRPEVPALAAGVVDCDGGTNLGVTIRQDHRVGVVGQAGFTAQSCATAGGTVEMGGLPHPNVCNGPLTVEPSANGDSGAGAVFIAPDATLGVNGLPADVSFAIGEECPGEQPAGFTDVFPLISNDELTEILHADNGNDALVYDNPGEGFSCPGWTQENGPGRLILSFPTLHGAIGGADVINAFVFDD